MWYVAPETLLDYQDYQQWIQDIAMNRNINFDPQNEEEFNDLSQQAWTHLLMQIIKVHTYYDCMSCVVVYYSCYHEGLGTSSCD